MRFSRMFESLEFIDGKLLFYFMGHNLCGYFFFCRGGLGPPVCRNRAANRHSLYEIQRARRRFQGT